MSPSFRLIQGPRQSGKTARLFQEVIDFLAENGGKAYVIAGPTQRSSMEAALELAGLVDVVFVSPSSVSRLGRLWGIGCDDRIFVDNYDMLSEGTQRAIDHAHIVTPITITINT